MYRKTEIGKCIEEKNADSKTQIEKNADSERPLYTEMLQFEFHIVCQSTLQNCNKISHRKLCHSFYLTN